MTGTIVRRVGHATVVHLSGEVDLTVADALHRRISHATAERPALVLDLSDVSFLDSAGVRLVDELARDCTARAAALTVVAPERSAPRMALHMCGFPDALLAPTVEEAVRDAGDPPPRA